MSNTKTQEQIPELSESEFLSFLYAERDREYSLSQYQGWNNWALVGAFVAVVCAGYTMLRENSTILWKDVLYYSGTIMVYFWMFHSWWRFLKPKRGVDFSKVRMLVEVAPFLEIGFVFICAVTSSILISIVDGFNNVFWWWIIVIVVFSFTVLAIIVFRNKLVPSYFDILYMPWVGFNVAYVFLATYVLVVVANKSFKMTTMGVFSSEFAVSTCIAVCFVLIFILLKINTGNKSVRRFEEILDNYLYMNVSKEDTFKKIMINRMGYGVLDACSKEFDKINKLMKKHIDEVKKLDEISEQIDAGHCTIEQIDSFRILAMGMLDDHDRILNLSTKLTDRMEEILNLVPYYENIPEIKHILETNKVNNKEIKSAMVKIKSTLSIIKENIKGGGTVN